jgi:NitT/TauT family transport system permease protein
VSTATVPRPGELEVERLSALRSIGTGIRSGLRPIALPLVTTVAVLLAWEGLVRWYRVPAIILPPPSDVLTTIVRLHDLLLQHAVPTTVETVAGFLLATVLGVGLAVAITYSAVVREALYPLLVVFQLIPKIALAPLFIVWLGIGSPSRLAFSLFISFFPIVIATAAGLIDVDRDAVRLGRSLSATEWQIFRKIRFPHAVPHLFGGMKVAMTLAIIGVIVGEFITAQAGLGYLIIFATSRAETAVIMAAITILCAIGLVLYGLVALGERMMKRWYGE